ncbi:MMPL family transporter [Nocardioides mangrovi]|uniref:MMPL family transporter n=1 Tax=Nocardioides mangrovi TaxID=2874580 RepID=A0ABS7U9M1_9ACTN|nr:MMPL family transporter [Nocardioides mangrovi]MBZ5737680.1 MMPL family transporter [Nocardioides mangrovi]
MSRLLRRLGTLTHRFRYLVVATWLALVVLLGLGVATWGNDLADEFSVPGSESQIAIDTVDREFPGAGGATVQVVMTAPEGETLASGSTGRAVEQSLTAASQVTGVAGVVPPGQSGQLTDDGRVGVADVRLTAEKSEVDDATLDAVEAALDPAVASGVEVDFTGSAYGSGPGGSSHAAEAVGVLLALVVIAVTVGSLIAAGLPILTALIGVVVGLSGIWLASDVTAISTTAPSLAMMLGLAVGIDYALLLLVRHRSELRGGASVRDAVATTAATAGTSVVFAGTTVVIALLGLAVARLPFLTVMGVAAAGMVVVAVLVATTLVPALLSILGERLRPRDRRTPEPEVADRGPHGERWVRGVARRPVRVLVGGVLALAVLAIPVASMQLALPDAGSEPTDSSVRQGYDTVADSFGPGVNGPLLVLADLSASSDPAAAAASVTAQLAATDGVAQVGQPRLSADEEWALVQVVPTTGPADAATQDLVDSIRSESADLATATGATIQVTGATAQGIDVSSRLSGALLPFALVVVGLSFVLLVLVFGSILVPLTAALGYLLSLGAALGVTVAVFQWGWLGDGITGGATGPLVSFSPVIVMAVLFGLAMDYQLFLVSRIHEAVLDGVEPRAAIAEGGRHSARVVVAAALIMTGVFGSFVVAGSPTLRSIALALTVGVLVDAFVVRLTLVPAALGLLGHRAWWLPRWLGRRLPRLHVEGTPAAEPART